MKTRKTMALLLLLGFLGSGCATMSRLNAEYEEELVRIEQMTPEEKTEQQKINWDEFVGGGDAD